VPAAAAADEPSGAAAGDGQACYVCCESVADAVFLNCGHGGMCFACARRHVSAQRGRRPLCPLCRERVVQVVQIGGVERSVGDHVVVSVR
jgi:hypothetical protein